MKTSFYAGASGLRAHQAMIDNIGNNIANVNTEGFKAPQVSFQTLLYNEMYANTPTEPLTGNGVMAVSTGINVGQGNLLSTNDGLHFAIIGDGFFAVQGQNGTEYTRAGAFIIQTETDMLTTVDGLPVLDSDGDAIELDYNEDGGTYDLTTLTETLGVFAFENPSSLDPTAATRYLETALSGPATGLDSEQVTIMQGYLEASSVNMADEMVNLITAQRGYQMSARVVQTADENEQTINSLRG